MKNIIVLIVILLLLFGAGGYFYFKTMQDTEPASDIAVQAQQYCTQDNVASVEISRSTGFIKVVSTMLGGGATYYSEAEETPRQCPVVAPDAMTDECKVLMAVTDWYVLCENTTVPPVSTPSNEEAELTGFNFILDTIALTATTSSSTALEEKVLGALSLNAQSKVSQETLSRDLAMFLGIQDVPDQGASVEDLQVTSATEAELVVGLNYSGGRTVRVVHLIVENGAWKIDSVSSAPNTNADFEKEGNLTTQNESVGTTSTWTLVYDEPGKPALTKKLTFDSASICATGVENSTCDLSSFTAGQRVKIIGTTVDEESVLVVRLENN